MLCPEEEEKRKTFIDFIKKTGIFQTINIGLWSLKFKWNKQMVMVKRFWESYEIDYRSKQMFLKLKQDEYLSGF